MQNMLTSVDRVASKLGPLTHLLDAIVERVVPHKVAQACTCTYKCSSRLTTGGNGCPSSCNSRYIYTCAPSATFCSHSPDTWTCQSACFC